MKCPRCSMADLSNNQCPICHLEYKPNPVERLKAKVRLRIGKIKLRLGDIPRKLWEANLGLYHYFRPVMFMLSMVVVGMLVGVAFQMANWAVTGFAVWFAVMAFYEFHKMWSGRHRNA